MAECALAGTPESPASSPSALQPVVTGQERKLYKNMARIETRHIKFKLSLGFDKNIYMSVSFFAFVHNFLFVFLLFKAEYQTKIIDGQKFIGHPHLAKTFSYPKLFYKHDEHHGKLAFFGVKFDQPNST